MGHVEPDHGSHHVQRGGGGGGAGAVQSRGPGGVSQPDGAHCGRGRLPRCPAGPCLCLEPFLAEPSEEETERLTERLTEWLTERIMERLTEQLTERLMEWLTERLMEVNATERLTAGNCFEGHEQNGLQRNSK